MRLSLIDQTLVLTRRDNLAEVVIHPLRSLQVGETRIELRAVGLVRTELHHFERSPDWLWHGDLDSARCVAQKVLTWIESMHDIAPYFCEAGRSESVETAA